jgi:hypothetical protein
VLVASGAGFFKMTVTWVVAAIINCVGSAYSPLRPQRSNKQPS